MKGEEAALRLDRAERELSALKISSDRAMKNLLDARNDFSGDLIFYFALFPSIRVYLLYLSVSLTIYLYIDLFILYIYLWIYLSIDLYILLFGLLFIHSIICLFCFLLMLSYAYIDDNTYPHVLI